MADRDLIHKPIQLPAIEDKSSATSQLPAPVRGPLGVQVRSKEVASEKDAGLPLKRKTTGAPVSRQPASKTPSDDSDAKTDKAPAFKAAYFNQDVGATGLVNQRASFAQALRGGEGASDLKRVVLPPPAREGAPDADVLRDAAGRMAGDAERPPSLADLLGRQGSALSHKNITPELIKERIKQLELMVESRKAALLRMAKLAKKAMLGSPSLTQASVGSFSGDDPTEHAEELIRVTGHQAEGLHQRLAKVVRVRQR